MIDSFIKEFFKYNLFSILIIKGKEQDDQLSYAYHPASLITLGKHF